MTTSSRCVIALTRLKPHPQATTQHECPSGYGVVPRNLSDPHVYASRIPVNCGELMSSSRSQEKRNVAPNGTNDDDAADFSPNCHVDVRKGADVVKRCIGAFSWRCQRSLVPSCWRARPYSSGADQQCHLHLSSGVMFVLQ